MNTREKIKIACKLYQVLGKEQREDLIRYINAEYNYDMELDWTIGDIISVFAEDNALEVFENHLLFVIVQFHSEDEDLYLNFLHITGFDDHIKFLEHTNTEVGAPIVPEEKLDKSEAVIQTHDGCSISHALEMAKVNPKMKVEIGFMTLNEPTKFHIQVVE